MKRWMVMEEPKCYQERIMRPEREKDWFSLLRSPPCSFCVILKSRLVSFPVSLGTLRCQRLCCPRLHRQKQAGSFTAGFVRGSVETSEQTGGSDTQTETDSWTGERVGRPARQNKEPDGGSTKQLGLATVLSRH